MRIIVRFCLRKSVVRLKECRIEFHVFPFAHSICTPIRNPVEFEILAFDVISNGRKIIPVACQLFRHVIDTVKSEIVCIQFIKASDNLVHIPFACLHAVCFHGEVHCLAGKRSPVRLPIERDRKENDDSSFVNRNRHSLNSISDLFIKTCNWSVCRKILIKNLCPVTLVRAFLIRPRIVRIIEATFEIMSSAI